MKIALSLYWLVSMIVGLSFILTSMWYRKPDHPTIDGSHKFKDVFRQFTEYRKYYDKNGFKYYIAGAIIFGSSLIVNLVNTLFII